MAVFEINKHGKFRRNNSNVYCVDFYGKWEKNIIIIFNTDLKNELKFLPEEKASSVVGQHDSLAGYLKMNLGRCGQGSPWIQCRYRFTDRLWSRQWLRVARKQIQNITRCTQIQ